MTQLLIEEYRQLCAKYSNLLDKFQKKIDDMQQETKALREALEWLAPYAEVQVRLYPDATDTPDWQRLLAALANTTKESKTDE